MIDFWTTGLTAKDLMGDNYHYFNLFDKIHISGLIQFVLICIVSVYLFKKIDKDKQNKCLTILALLIFADELVKYFSTVLTDQWSWTYLPLHLCSINVYMVLLHTIMPDDVTKDFLYCTSIPGALIALLSPSWLALPVFNLMHLHSYTIHVMLVLYPLLLIAGGYRPNYRNIKRVFIRLLVIATFVYFFNFIFETNFMFLRDPYENALSMVFSNILGDKLYVLGFVVVLLVLWTLMYLPWYLLDKNKIVA